jgi:hypothetical protein
VPVQKPRPALSVQTKEGHMAVGCCDLVMYDVEEGPKEADIV